MRILSALVFLPVAVLAVAQTQAPPAGEFASIEGIVAQAGTGRVLAGARISLERIEAGATENEVVTPVATDDAGRFRIDGVAPGQYRIFADLEGYVRSEYGQRAAGSTGTAVVLVARERLSARLDMTPGGVISGRVYDESGEPVVGAVVTIEVPRYVRGYRIVARPTPTLSPRQIPVMPTSASTNDLGEYRLVGLSPGEYYVSARKTESARLESVADLSQQAAPQSGPATRPLGTLVGGTTSGGVGVGVGTPPGFAGALAASTPVTTYYPGTDTSEDAETVRVAAAAETGGVNIRWGQTAPVVAIRGVVEGLPDPRTSPAGARLSSSPQFELSGPEGQTIRPLGTSMRSGGEFELRVFGARSVTLTARARGGGSPAGEYSGRVRIELGDQDVEGVRIPLRGPIESVPGRVTLASPGGDVDLQALSVRLEYGVLPGGSSSGGRGTRVQADGSFDLRDVGLRDYVLSLSSQQAADFYIESARYGTDDPLSGWFTPVDDAQRRLEIVVGTSFGDLTGRVVANEGAWAGAMVTLVPDGDRIGRSDLYRSIPTDGEGRYRLERVPVGRYRLFAWNRIPDGAVENADFMLPYRGRGQPVTVEANGSGEVDLRLIVR